MKKLLIVFLLFALPLHLSWAVAASYCQHEGGKTAQHFGHHTHQHQASAGGNNDSGNSPLMLHADCSICHLSLPAAAVSVQAVPVMPPALLAVADLPHRLQSIFPEAPERPNWTSVA